MLTANVAGHLIEDVPFTVSRITAALLHTKRASAGISHDSFRPKGQDKKDILQNDI
jgi:hypothetical protein